MVSSFVVIYLDRHFYFCFMWFVYEITITQLNLLFFIAVIVKVEHVAEHVLHASNGCIMFTFYE